MSMSLLLKSNLINWAERSWFGYSSKPLAAACLQENALEKHMPLAAACLAWFFHYRFPRNNEIAVI